MKFVFIALALLPNLSFAAVEKIDGVPFECVNRVRYEMIREFAADSGDRDEIDGYKKMLRDAPAYACKERKDPSVEHVTWCDGSGCTGASARLSANGECVVSDSWSGQDDGDIIDPKEHRKNCLVKADFRR